MGAFFYGGPSYVHPIFISDGMNIYPNPSDGIYHIRFSDKAILEWPGKLQLKILNITGQIVYSEDILPGYLTEKKDINMNKYSKGIYYLQIISDKKNAMCKLILN